MKAEQIIDAFIQVIQEDKEVAQGKGEVLFSPEDIKDLAKLQQELEKIKNKSLESVKGIITEWLIKHKKIRDVVNLKIKKSREIKKVDDTKQVGQDYTVENRFRVLKYEVNDLCKKRKGEG